MHESTCSLSLLLIVITIDQNFTFLCLVMYGGWIFDQHLNKNFWSKTLCTPVSISDVKIRMFVKRILNLLERNWLKLSFYITVNKKECFKLKRCNPSFACCTNWFSLIFCNEEWKTTALTTKPHGWIFCVYYIRTQK